MKKTSLTALVALFFALSPLAHADDSPLRAFFASLAGHWSGTGAIQNLDSNGNIQSLGYEIQIQSECTDQDGVWAISNAVTTEAGATSQNSANYAVRGALLLVSTNSGTDPVQVTESTPFSLTYSFQRADVLTGRTYNFTIHTELNSDASIVSGHNSADSNGVTISDETFSARRW